MCWSCILLRVPMLIDSGSLQIDKLWLMVVYGSVQFTRIGLEKHFCFALIQCVASPLEVCPGRIGGKG